MRALFLHELLPSTVVGGWLHETGIDADDVREPFRQPNEIAEAITRLVLTENSLGPGALHASARPLVGAARRVAVERRPTRIHED
jgi:hypothetical protein